MSFQFPADRFLLLKVKEGSYKEWNMRHSETKLTFEDLETGKKFTVSVGCHSPSDWMIANAIQSYFDGIHYARRSRRERRLLKLKSENKSPWNTVELSKYPFPEPNR
jgi:hypothetical protein